MQSVISPSTLITGIKSDPIFFDKNYAHLQIRGNFSRVFGVSVSDLKWLRNVSLKMIETFVISSEVNLSYLQ